MVQSSKKAGLTSLGFSIETEVRNWGDVLLQEISEHFLNTEDLGHKFSGAAFGGSLLSQNYLNLSKEKSPVGQLLFYGCGIRDRHEILTDLQRISIYGVRGKFSEAILRTEAIGDPGILAPFIYDLSKSYSNLNESPFLFIPHMSDPNQNPKIDSCFETIEPLIGLRESAKRIVEKVAQASFVLTGSLHVGIVAFALGTPFSFYKNDFVDSPIKYYDFASFYDIPVSFSANISDGINFWLSNSGSYSRLTEKSIRKLHGGKISEFLKEGIESDKIRDFLTARTELINLKQNFLTSLSDNPSSNLAAN